MLSRRRQKAAAREAGVHLQVDTDMEKANLVQQCQHAEAAWKMICDLRQEIREAQKIRTQIIGIKITFVSAAFGFIFKDGSLTVGSPKAQLLLIPAFAAIFFDYLVISYGFSIKRIGYYCRHYLEPKLRAGLNWPAEDPFWEEAMNSPIMRQHFAITGNLGISLIATASAVVFMVSHALSLGEGIFLAALLLMLGLDLYFCFGFKYAPTEVLSGKVGVDGRWHPLSNTDKPEKNK